MKILLALCALCALAAPASAQFCDTNQSCFFPPGPCAYLGTEHVVFANGWQLTYIDFENSLDCPALPPIGGSANLLDHSTFVLKLQDGGTTTLVGGSALMTMHVFVVPPNVNPREVDLELLALDLTGSFPAGVRLRRARRWPRPATCSRPKGRPGSFTSRASSTSSSSSRSTAARLGRPRWARCTRS
jgi:hypothetical protein